MEPIAVDVSAIWRAHGAFVWRVLHHLGVKPADIEDATQEVFVSTNPEDFPAPSMVGTQLCGVTVINDATTIDRQDGSPAIAGALPAPTRGVSYLQLDTLRDLPERISQTMCGEMQPGVTYNFAIDLASRAGQTHEGEILGAGVLEIYGGNVACNHAAEPLWRSPPLSSTFRTYCVRITPAERIAVLTLQVPAKGHPRSAVLIDNIRLSETCGPAVVE